MSLFNRSTYITALLVAGVVLAVLATAKITATYDRDAIRGLPAAPSGYKWTKVFSDSFEDASLDSKKWTTCYDWYGTDLNGCTNAGNNELQWYVPEQVKVEGGQAILTATEKPIYGWDGNVKRYFPYQSGMISTGRPTSSDEPLVSFKYGYFETRMKAPDGKGVWPAFWLLPIDRTWPPEIDIMELTNGEKLHLTYHWKKQDGNAAKDTNVVEGHSYTSGWHTYAVNWQKDKLEWYVDGVLRKTAVGKNVPDREMELLLNLAVGGNLPGSPDQTAVFPTQMVIDYVNVFKLERR